MKTVVITGSTKGIGLGIAQYFHDRDYYVITNGRSKTNEFPDFRERAAFVQSDVSLRETHQKLVTAAREATGRIDAYINCAGISVWKPVAEIDDQFWNTMLDTNLKGTMWGCQAAAAAMPQGGAIINISSLAGKRGSTNNSVYCASKFGVNGLTQALAKELGRQNIRVNAVCPVYVETPTLIHELRKENAPPGNTDVKEYLANFAATQAALKRLPTAAEVAALCYYLASDAASAITGQCINVDCGVLPQ